MSDSVAPITIGRDWTDVYAASGITVGTPLLIIPVGIGGDVRLAVSGTKPTSQVGTRVPFNHEASIDGGQSGLWAISSGAPSTIYVQANTGGAIRLTPFSDSRIIDGNKAITTQPFTELNVKTGSQFYARASWPLADTILAGTTRKIHFIVGDSTILVKVRFFSYIAEELELQIFQGPTGVTGGSPIQISNWNAINPNVSVVSASKNVSTTSDGTPIQDPEFFFGSSATGQRIQESIPENIERVIPGNTEYLVTITNNSAGVARVEYGLTWYEGVLSTEVP